MTPIMRLLDLKNLIIQFFIAYNTCETMVCLTSFFRHHKKMLCRIQGFFHFSILINNQICPENHYIFCFILPAVLNKRTLSCSRIVLFYLFGFNLSQNISIRQIIFKTLLFSGKIPISDLKAKIKRLICFFSFIRITHCCKNCWVLKMPDLFFLSSIAIQKNPATKIIVIFNNY